MGTLYDLNAERAARRPETVTQTAASVPETVPATPETAPAIQPAKPARPRYLTLAETAAEVRAVVKAEFPGVKFSVKCRGGSVSVQWHDGPTAAQVNHVTHMFAGSTFDGMTDLQESKGAVLLRGEWVHMGANYVNASRGYSVAFLTRVAQRVARLYGVECPAITDTHGWGAQVSRANDEQHPQYPAVRVSDLILREASETAATF